MSTATVRIPQEAVHGPPADIFPSAADPEDDDDADDLLIKRNSGQEFDNEALRKYQLERLR